MSSWSQTQESLDGINIDRTQCRRICKSLSDKDYCQDLAGLAQQALRGRDDPDISSTLNYVTNITWLFWIISNRWMPLSFVNILPIARLEPFQGHRVILLLTKTVLVTLKKNQFIIVPKVSSYNPVGPYENNNNI